MSSSGLSVPSCRHRRGVEDGREVWGRKEYAKSGAKEVDKEKRRKGKKARQKERKKEGKKSGSVSISALATH
jgi:hypothetical protein